MTRQDKHPLPGQAQAVVIGGGVIGCSILYHLAKLGWRDVVLLERDELTSGSTWHAAANIHGLHDSTTISRLQHYTMQLYATLEAETGQSCGIFQPGSLYLARSVAREHQLRLQAAKAVLYGMKFHEIGVQEAKDRHPLVDFTGVRCVMFEPDGGNVDPSGVTQAYALGARQRGAQIHRFTPVLATDLQADGTWLIRTARGDIRTPWVINAAGLWGREVAALAGITLPLQPTEHQYFVTDTMPEVASLGRRLPSVSDRDGEYYLRHEGDGLLVGAYEKDVRLWAQAGTPLGFAHELFPDDLDRIADNMQNAINCVPALGRAGVKRVINGPMIWSPDGNVLMGPVPERPGYFCCNGIIPGFSQSGGMGLMAAQWIIEGAPEYDLSAWDVARFGDWATAGFTRARVRDQYAHRFAIHFPHQERSAGRPARTRPVYAEQQKMGAVFGLNAGWEHPLYFADRPGVADSAGFTRQPWWDDVAGECRMLRARGGIIDISTFAKYSCEGPQSEAWLNTVFANRMPRTEGRTCLTPLISSRGGIAGDFTVTRLAPDRFWIVGAGAAERAQQRLFQQVPLPPGTTFHSQSEAACGFAVAGPRARDMLRDLTDHPLETAAFPFLSGAQITLAGVRVTALRLSFTGDLGWELYCAASDQIRLYRALVAAGQRHGIGPVGSRALLSLRLEKGWGSWGRDLSPEYWPQECGMAALCRMDKPFLNRDALARVLSQPPRETLMLMALEAEDVAASGADATGGEPIMRHGVGIGRVTSGAYGHGVGQSLALGYLRDAGPGDRVEIMVLGRPHRARILQAPPFDPDGARLRG